MTRESEADSAKELTQARSQIDGLIAAGNTAQAVRELTALWASDSSAASFIVSRYRRIRENLPLVSCRVAIERSFTVEPLVPVLKAAAYVSGIEVDTYIGRFNMYSQEVLEPRSPLFEFKPDVVILATLTRDVLPELWPGPQVPTGDGACTALVERVLSHFKRLIKALRAQSGSHLIIHLFERPCYPSMGILDGRLDGGHIAAIQEINEGLKEFARHETGVYTLDYDGLVARFGGLNWRDELKWQTVRVPLKAEYMKAMVDEWLRFLHPITGKIGKVVAFDLDNTVWGGVIGEDGLSGIALGAEYPGSAFKGVQRALLDLLDRGVLLAVCSKNNPEDALDVFRQHPEMLIKLDQISAVRTNWNEKSENLRSIAAELNVGLDSMVFVDDNPVERNQVRIALPEVHVLELPDNPMAYADAVRSCPLFERLSMSTEDTQRFNLYSARKEILALEAQLGTKEDFCRYLEQKTMIEPVNEMSLVRASQLTQKTNQFNLTTRRYSEQQISQLMATPGWQALTVRVIDRYVDNGIIGVALTRDSEGRCEIDTFLLSCRVIGRGVETAFLAHIIRDARNRGVQFMVGRFIETAKNEPCRRFFKDHGFIEKETPEGVLWQLDLSEADVAWPSWIQALPQTVAAL